MSSSEERDTIRRPSRHEAAALRYDPGVDGAPRLVAKGKGIVADRILEIAREHGVPVREDAALAQVLSALELFREIPPPMYRAVAEVLAFLCRLSEDRRARETGPGRSAKNM